MFCAHARCQVMFAIFPANMPQHFELWHLFLWHVVFDVTIAVNMCISSYSVNSCVTRIFAHTLQELILLTILLSSSLFTTKYFLHYLFMWNASLLLTVQKRRVNCEPWTQPSSSVALSFGTCPYSTKTIVLYGQLYRDICKRRYRTLKKCKFEKQEYIKMVDWEINNHAMVLALLRQSSNQR